MADTDISRIVSVIMENPKLIEEIRGLIETAPEAGASNTAEDNGAAKETAELQPITEKSDTREKSRPQNLHRKDLLSALKPYVSKERAQAIDSMLSIADVLEIMRR